MSGAITAPTPHGGPSANGYCGYVTLAYIMHVAAWSLMLVFLPPVRYWVAPLIARRCGSRRVFLCPFQDLLHELVAFRLSRMVNYFWHKHLTLAALAKGLYLGML